MTKIYQLRAEGTCIGAHRVVRSRLVFRDEARAAAYVEEWRPTLCSEKDVFAFDEGEPLEITVTELELVE